MGITPGQRTLCLNLVQRTAYASTEAQYIKLHDQFQKDVPKQVVQYFNESWHPIRSEWVMGLQSSCGNFLNSTNNRLESINGKLKQVINRHSSLEDFVDKFFVILTALRTERDHRAALMFQKVKVCPFASDSSESEYSKLLTSYTSPMVIKQIELAKKVKAINEVDGHYSVETSEGEKRVSLTDCECIFRRSMLLPCRHMFALRSKLGQPLYASDLCDKQWTTAYYRSTQRLFSSANHNPEVVLTESTSKPVRNMSQHEKFRKAVVLTSELASVVSVASNVHFQRRMKLLKDLIKHWKCGEEVDLVEVDEGKQIVIMVCNKGIIFITHIHTHMNIVDSEVSLSGDDGDDGEHNEQVAPQTRKILTMKTKKPTNDNPSPEKPG